MGYYATRIYTYTLKHKKGKDNGHADGLSRLPLPHIPHATPTPGDIVNLMETIDKGPVNAQQIKEGTSRDPVLAKVRHYILNVGLINKVDMVCLSPVGYGV